MQLTESAPSSLWNNPVLRCGRVCRLAIASLVASGALVACGGDDEPATAADTSESGAAVAGESEASASGDTTGSSQAETEGSTQTGMTGDSVYDCDDSDLSVILPPTGPGADGKGQLLDLSQEQYVLHSTVLVVRPGSREEALALSLDVVGEMMALPGLVATAAAESAQCGYLRTYGIWQSEAEMYAILGTPAHIAAVGRTFDVGVSAKTTHWTATVDEVRQFGWEVASDALTDVEPYE